jgi:hypothetical protein
MKTRGAVFSADGGSLDRAKANLPELKADRLANFSF